MIQPAVLSLDIGGTTTRAARFEDGRMVWREACSTPAGAGPERVVENALALLAPARLGARALGVAMTGRVHGGGVTAMNAETLPGWAAYPLQTRLSETLGLPVAVLNDARAAAWGEYTFGAGRGATHFMFVTVSTGIGAGLVLGGQLHLAESGLEGELGFTLAPGELRQRYHLPHLPPLSELEFEASGSALGAARSGRGARALADAAEAGDADAGALYGRSASLIAWKLADLTAVLGLERVALGGSVGLRPGYLARVRAALERLPHRPQVVAAELGADAGLVGAARRATRAPE